MLTFWRRSGLAVALAVAAWTVGGCASVPRPAIEPSFAARTYTPIRIALLPPDVFMILDQVGDNDPAKSELLRQQVWGELVKLSTQALRARGYDVDLSARWDGIVGADGQLLVSREDLGWMANGILQFANSPAGAQQGPLQVPQIVAPELAAKIGWATNSDALLYANLKGITTTNGKRAAEVIGAVFIVVIIAVIVLAMVAESKGGGGGGGGGVGSGRAGRSSAPSWGSRSAGGRPVAAPAVRGGTSSMRAVPPPAGGFRAPVPAGRGPRPLPVGGRRGYYAGGPQVDIGVGVIIPLDGPVYTHEGEVAHDDEWFGGDQLYLSMTLVNAADGRVLWHLKEDLDLDAEDPRDIQALVGRVVGSIPLRGGLVEKPATAAKP